jgi:hypothetical protein
MELFTARITTVAAIKITLQADQGVTISSIASGCCGNLISSDNQSATVDLYNLYTGQQINFIVYLTVPPGKEKLVTVGGQYKRLNTSENLVAMDVVIERPRRKCLADEVIVHPKVTAGLLRIRLMKGIAKQNQDLSRNSIRLLLDEIKNSPEGFAAPEEILSDLKEEVAEMMDRNGGNMEYILSWLNCHQLQHSTNKGTLPNIGAFQTLEEQRVHERVNLVNLCSCISFRLLHFLMIS